MVNIIHQIRIAVDFKLVCFQRFFLVFCCCCSLCWFYTDWTQQIKGVLLPWFLPPPRHLQAIITMKIIIIKHPPPITPKAHIGKPSKWLSRLFGEARSDSVKKKSNKILFHWLSVIQWTLQFPSLMRYLNIISMDSKSTTLQKCVFDVL